jgi:hypothetical protein
MNYGMELALRVQYSTYRYSKIEWVGLAKETVLSQGLA